MTSEDQQAAGSGEELPPVPPAQVGPPRPAFPAHAYPEPAQPEPIQPEPEPIQSVQPEPVQPSGVGHGARPVPVANAAAPFSIVEPAGGRDQLSALGPREPIGPLPDDHHVVLDIARRQLRRGALAPVVGWEGGIGRTTITRALAGAFRRVRGEDPVTVDAVPMWGALSAAADHPGEYCPADLATMSWPIPAAVMPRLLTTVDGLPTLAGPSPSRGVLSEPRTMLTAIDRMAKLARLTFIDTVADVAGSPTRDLIRNPNSAVVWVASATRTGLWGVAEALTYFHAIGAEHVARRSVVAIVGSRRHWPADAAAAEAQLTGLGVETVRVPHSAKPLTDSKCRPSIERLLAAVVLRSS